MRRAGEGRPSRDSSWQEEMLEEMLEVEGGRSTELEHSRAMGQEQTSSVLRDGARRRG